MHTYIGIINTHMCTGMHTHMHMHSHAHTYTHTTHTRTCAHTHTHTHTHTQAHTGSCAKFLIDVAVEILILYEHEYEIYGDIQAANNCFKIDAYQQGEHFTMDVCGNQNLGLVSSMVYSSMYIYTILVLVIPCRMYSLYVVKLYIACN